MSMDYLLLAVRNQLRATLVTGLAISPTEAARSCDIQPDGHPATSMGEWYVSIDEGGVQSGDKAFLKEVFSLAVYITKRTGQFPKDRYGQIYSTNAGGLSKIERLVIPAIHGSQAVRNAANTLAGVVGDGSAGDIYQQPLYYTGRQKTAPQMAEWAGGQGEGGMFTYLVRRLEFRGGTRIQSLDIMH